ncbi:MAG: hypothetical protein LBU45_02575 [Azoarcus sp.]|jgi:hypothetical protein|nr:hypothetical protein [Azoarcus sp.]
MTDMADLMNERRFMAMPQRLIGEGTDGKIRTPVPHETCQSLQGIDIYLFFGFAKKIRATMSFGSYKHGA